MWFIATAHLDPTGWGAYEGDEVFITYAYDGNDHLLLDYGFAEEARPGQLGSEVCSTITSPTTSMFLAHRAFLHSTAHMICNLHGG